MSPLYIKGDISLIYPIKKKYRKHNGAHVPPLVPASHPYYISEIILYMYECCKWAELRVFEVLFIKNELAKFNKEPLNKMYGHHNDGGKRRGLQKKGIWWRIAEHAW